MSGLIGKKIGMTSLYDNSGKNVACTVLEAGPCSVSQIKTNERDGYQAIQLAYDDKNEKKIINSEKGHFNKANLKTKKKLVEFKNFEEEISLGDTISVGHFSEGDYVDVSAFSKGKGFKGVVKRHGFGGVGQATHGQHNRLRAPGSIGAASYPARVFKGMRMAGQMGNRKVKILNLRVIKIVPEKNLLILKGSIPGPKNAYLTIQK